MKMSMQDIKTAGVRSLTEAESALLRQYARDHYVPGTDIPGTMPFDVQAECMRMTFERVAAELGVTVEAVMHGWPNCIPSPLSDPMLNPERDEAPMAE